MFFFQHFGLANALMSYQLSAWVDDINEAGLGVNKTPRNRLDSFRPLKGLIRKSMSLCEEP